MMLYAFSSSILSLVLLWFMRFPPRYKYLVCGNGYACAVLMSQSTNSSESMFWHSTRVLTCLSRLMSSLLILSLSLFFTRRMHLGQLAFLITSMTPSITLSPSYELLKSTIQRVSFSRPTMFLSYRQGSFTLGNLRLSALGLMAVSANSFLVRRMDLLRELSMRGRILESLVEARTEGCIVLEKDWLTEGRTLGGGWLFSFSWGSQYSSELEHSSWTGYLEAYRERQDLMCSLTLLSEWTLSSLRMVSTLLIMLSYCLFNRLIILSPLLKSTFILCLLLSSSTHQMNFFPSMILTCSSALFSHSLYLVVILGLMMHSLYSLTLDSLITRLSIQLNSLAADSTSLMSRLKLAYASWMISFFLSYRRWSMSCLIQVLMILPSMNAFCSMRWRILRQWVCLIFQKSVSVSNLCPLWQPKRAHSAQICIRSIMHTMSSALWWWGHTSSSCMNQLVDGRMLVRLAFFACSSTVVLRQKQEGQLESSSWGVLSIGHTTQQRLLRFLEMSTFMQFQQKMCLQRGSRRGGLCSLQIFLQWGQPTCSSSFPLIEHYVIDGTIIYTSIIYLIAYTLKIMYYMGKMTKDFFPTMV